MSKGLGIKVIGGMTLALVSVSILLATFSSNFGGSSGVFCETYESVSVVFPGQDSPPPKGCEQGRTVDYKSIEADTSDEFSLRLSNAVIACYDRYKGYETTEFCEGWNVKELPNPVDENNFTKVLKQSDVCPESINNNKTEHGTGETCGSSNQIYFKKNEISENDFIVIEYNVSKSGTNRVEIR